MDEERKQHLRDIQKKHYNLNIEKCRQNKKQQYYYKFFSKEYVNNIIDTQGHTMGILQLKIDRLKQQQQNLQPLPNFIFIY